MQRFYLFLIGFLLAFHGFCQDSIPFDSGFMVTGMTDDLLSLEDGNHCDAMLSAGFLVMTQDNNDEVKSSEYTGTAIIPQIDYKESKYWGRYTALRTAGWITFGAGIGFFIGGYAMILGAWAATSDAGHGLGVAGSSMLFSSPVLVLTSIPLLACAYYNRNKAKKMCLNVGTSMLSTGGHSPFNTSTPALSFSITF